MNKSELVKAMAEKCDLTQKDTEKVLDAFQKVVIEELVRGGKVQLVGFGIFEVMERAAREGRNPKTHEPMQVPASKIAKFKVGKNFKDILNGR